MSTLTSNLDESCRRALDVAKRVVGEGLRLDVATLLAAVYHHTDLKDQELLAPLRPFISEPQPVRDQPQPTRVDASLKQVLQGLTSFNPVTPPLLFTALVRSDAGRQYFD